MTKSFILGFILTGKLFAAQPNIVVILADDLGYGDVGVYGCKDVPTPHIDSIAKNGVRFTNGYADHPVCSPSRAGLMAGRYQQRFGFEHNSGPERFASPKFGVPRSVPILAEKLKGAGYATGMMGKWHIGFREGLRPHERGFDETYVFHSGARSFYPKSTRRNNAPLMRNGKPFEEETEYLTDAFARESVSFIEKNKKAPFFLYLAFNAVHAPLEATTKYEQRFTDITNRKRKTYAGMLSAMDDAVGRVLAKLREHKLEKNTLVFFYSDNGGPTAQTTSRNDPLRGYKGQFFEGGIRIPYVIQWKGVLPEGKVYHEPVRGFDVHATALAAAGIKTPKAEPMDGKNLIPFLEGKEKGRPHEQLFWRAGRQHAARVGNWKLVSQRNRPEMLFNLKEDIGETTDLAKKNPEKLKELQNAFTDWSKQMKPAQWIRQDGSNAQVDGKLKANPTGSKPLVKFFERADRNGDGVISEDEIKNKTRFKAADTNLDGKVTLLELRTLFRDKNKPAQPKEEGHRSSYYKNGEIYVNILGTPEGKPLTTGHWDFKPSWSKTGDMLVFFRRLKNDPDVSKWKTAICIINADGTGFHQITDANHTNFNQTWTRDGSNTPIWNRKNPKGGGYHVMSGKVGGKPGEEVPLTDKGTHTWAYTCLTDGRILVNHSHPEQGRGYYLMTPAPRGKPAFQKIQCDLAKRGYLDRLSLSVDETKICFEYQRGFKRKVPGRTLYVADFDAKTRTITNAKPFANAEGKQVWFAYPRWTFDQSAIVYHAGGALYLYTLKSGETQKVSTDDKADYRYPHGEATPK